MIYGGLEIKLVNVRNLYGEASTQDTKLKRNKYTLLVSEFRPVEAESRSFEVESSPGCKQSSNYTQALFVYKSIFLNHNEGKSERYMQSQANQEQFASNFTLSCTSSARQGLYPNHTNTPIFNRCK